MDEETPDQNTPVQFRIEVPDGMESGLYANFMSSWSSPHDFTLDFAVTGQAEQVDTEGDHSVVIPCRVVARIKVPLTLAQDILRAMAETVSKFEETAGTIRKPGDDRPTYPPEAL